jgi:hypothetical protein
MAEKELKRAFFDAKVQKHEDIQGLTDEDAQASASKST